MSTTPIQLPDVEPPKYYSPFDARAKLMNLQNLAQQQQIGQMSIQEHQRALAQTQAINQAYKDAFTIGDDGRPQLDEGKFSQALATGGHGSAIPGILEANTKYKKSLADLAEVKGKVAAAEQEAAGNLGATVQASKNDPHVFLTLATNAVHNGAVGADHVKPLMDNVTAALAQDPTGETARALVGQYTDMMVAGSNKQRELRREEQTAQSTQLRNTAQTNLANVETEQKRQMGPFQVTQAQETARKTTLEADELQRKLDMIKNTKPSDVLALVDQVVPPDVKANRALNLRTKFMVTAKLNQGDFAGAQDVIKTAASEMRQLEVATDPRVQAGKIAVTVAGAAGRANAVADAGGLTEDDYQRAGEQYIRTGVMPALGRDSVTRSRIVKAGNQWARDNGLNPQDVVTMQAAYAGDKDSLKKFQAQRDQISAFEQTARKNLDLFLNAASKIPDTGVPWLNTPLRNLNANLIGSENMAAVNAARQIANNEIAKVTSGGGLGGVLSDSARHEIGAYNPQNATFAQTLAVAKILKADMANRMGSMDATLSEIKGRIGGQQQGGGGGAKASGLKVGDSVMYQGRRHKITAIDPATGKLTLEQ